MSEGKQFLILVSEQVDGKPEFVLHTQLAHCSEDDASREARRIAGILHKPVLLAGSAVSFYNP
jgi:hypothetical protein